MGDKIHVPNAPRNKTLQALLQIEEHQWSAFRKTLAALSHKHLDITQTPSRQRAQVAKVQSKLAARFPTVDLHDRQQLVFLSRYMAREHGERRRRAENERKLALRAAGELGSRADGMYIPFLAIIRLAHFPPYPRS
ncbi:hypothetical protein FA15DRAFT_385185 [Coprinopsis marcescibilis]|uniref:Uncharacterized protein n=1 Tax=Coprinopsis marcescibilis TaxID=230819 RepID=A0A5C3KAF0_COPMA|nr:hypothetical protein FA15DRAFT_385185 [Coprinopsis marcescibilis]